MTTPSSKPSQDTGAATIAEHEALQVDRANATGRQPVVFVHGLWLLPSSWDRWATVFEEAGYTPLTPGWPDDPETVDEANAHPEVFAHKTVGQVADHFDRDHRPAARSARRSSVTPSAVCSRRSSPGAAARRRPWPSTRPLPRRASASSVEREVRLARPAATRPTATAPCRSRTSSSATPSPTPSAKPRPRSFTRPSRCRRRARRSSRPRPPTSIRGRRRRSTPSTPSAGRCSSSPAKRTTRCPGRSPTPRSSCRSATRASPRSSQMPNRGHALTIDSGWREVADKALAFVRRFASP